MFFYQLLYSLKMMYVSPGMANVQLDQVRESILAKTRGSYGQSVKECFDIFRKWGGVKRGNVRSVRKLNLKFCKPKFPFPSQNMDFNQFSTAMKACGIGSRQAAYKYVCSDVHGALLPVKLSLTYNQ